MYFRIKAINTGYWTCCFLNLHTYHGAASYPTLSGNSRSVEDERAQPQTAFPYHFYSVEKTSPWLRKHHQCWENITRVEKTSPVLRKHHPCWENITHVEKTSPVLRKHHQCWENISRVEKTSHMLRKHHPCWKNIIRVEKTSPIIWIYNSQYIFANV